MLRGMAAWCWLTYVLLVAYAWLGVLGITLVCLCGRPHWRNLFAIEPNTLVFDATTLTSAWLSLGQYGCAKPLEARGCV